MIQTNRHIIQRKRWDDKIKITYHQKIKRVSYREEMMPNTPCSLMRWLFRQPEGFVVWDTETTGLEDDSKIITIGAVDQDGNVLLDLRLNPGEPIPYDATEIHGVTDDMVTDAPTFEQCYKEIQTALAGRIWVIYNRSYDVPRLNYECDRAYVPWIKPKQIASHGYTSNFKQYDRPQSYCAMESFAEFYGDYSEYWGNYKWQRLSTAANYFNVRVENAHNALADAKMALAVMRGMAFSEDKEWSKQ
jgi:DNA polymerase III epsilon subunit-like protein